MGPRRSSKAAGQAPAAAPEEEEDTAAPQEEEGEAQAKKARQNKEEVAEECDEAAEAEEQAEEEEDEENEAEAEGETPQDAVPAPVGETCVVEAPGEAAQVVAPPRGEGAPRLMIKQIVLENFKSYGGRKLIGPFHKSFSSIVGPNGSGKSNTIDALLFVFGKRAKKMRLNKVSELIHASTGLTKLPSAKVEVVFQDIIDTGTGAEDYKVVPGSELSVGREAFRNNQSKYYVDGKPSNFTEVTALLRKRGVDLEHNRFLILQGEVEQISLMKPKAQTPHEEGLFEYLEDIIGSNRYLELIEEAEKVVKDLTEQRQEKLNRLRVAERERESLDGPRKEAEAWVLAEAERLEILSLLAQFEAHRSHEGIAGLEEQRKVLDGHMAKHREKMETFETEVKGIEGKHNELLKEYQSQSAQMDKAANDFKEFERQDVKFTEDIAFQEERLQKLEQAADKEKDNALQLVADAQQLRKEAPVREQELESLERHKASVTQKLEKVYAGLKGKAEKLRPAKEAKEAELVPLQKRLTDVRKVVEVAQTEAQLLREKTSKAADAIEEVKKSHGECGGRLEERRREIKEATKLKKQRVELVAEAKGRLNDVAKELDKVAAEVQSTRSQAEEAKAAFEQENTRGRLIKAVYEQSRAGRLHGVHGRLGDLGTIAKKYDVAVSTACGMLDAIVVETTEDAQAVIEFIRRENLGRTTCICMKQIQERARDMELRTSTPEGAPRLVDLIKPSKPEYKVAFYFALRDTLVADDLDQATRIGLKGRTRWRVVTLQGGLIDTSGTMSGGGHSVARGGMRASLCPHSPEEVARIVQAFEKASARLSSIRQEKQALTEAVQLTEKEIAELDFKERNGTLECNSLQKQMDAYDERLKSMKVPTLTGSEKSKLKELEKLIGSRSDELNDINSQHHAVEEEVRELHNQIMNIGGEELRVAKSNLEEATKKCDEMRHRIKKAVLDAENMERNSKKAEANAKTALEERKGAEKQLAALKEEHAQLDDKAELVLNAYNQLKEAVGVKDGQLQELRKQRNDVIAQAQAWRSQEVDLVNEMEETKNKLRDLYSRMAAWGKKLEEARVEHKQLPLDLVAEARGVTGTDADDMGRSLGRKAITTDLKEDELSTVVRADLDARMLTLDANLKNMKPNLSSIEEFRRADEQHKSRLAEYEGVHSQREDARKGLQDLRQKRLEEFMDGFSVISMKLKEMYQMITLGGDAELELVDTLDPFSEGIQFSVRPPKKSWKQITNLSGGEKTLASLSLVFALHHYKPTPLYFMDEIDAALDFRNVSIIANYIKERTQNAQFIVISLRNHMFELADLLVGIYKTQDKSKSVAINPTAFDLAKPPLMDAGGERAALGNKRPLVPIADGPTDAMGPPPQRPATRQRAAAR